MPKKRVRELAEERDMDPQDVLAELRDSGHDVSSASSSVEEHDAVRALDVGVHRIAFERDGEFLGAAYVKGDNDLAAWVRAKDELKIFPEHTHCTLNTVGLTGAGGTEDAVPRDMRNRLLSPAELDELARTVPDRTEARLGRESPRPERKPIARQLGW